MSRRSLALTADLLRNEGCLTDNLFANPSTGPGCVFVSFAHGISPCIPMLRLGVFTLTLNVDENCQQHRVFQGTASSSSQLRVKMVAFGVSVPWNAWLAEAWAKLGTSYATPKTHLDYTMSEIKSLAPKTAYAALQANPAALLIDVRDTLEFGFVGHPPGTVNVPWKEWSNRQWQANPDFVAQMVAQVPNKATQLLLLCRSGQRSLDAAKALAEVGYTDLTNIEEGFEGDLDSEKHRSNVGGWRCHGLPWEQS